MKNHFLRAQSITALHEIIFMNVCILIFKLIFSYLHTFLGENCSQVNRNWNVPRTSRALQRCLSGINGC